MCYSYSSVKESRKLLCATVTALLKKVGSYCVLQLQLCKESRKLLCATVTALLKKVGSYCVLQLQLC